MSVVLGREKLPVDGARYPLPTTGIRIRLALVGDRELAHLAGGHRPDRHGWSDPVALGDDQIDKGVHSDEEDVWFRANRRGVALFCRVLRGEAIVPAALAAGAFDLEKPSAWSKCWRRCWPGGDPHEPNGGRRAGRNSACVW